MKKGYFSVGTAALLSLGLFTSQALAQDFCSSGAHSGTSTKTNGTRNNDEYQTISKIGNFNYELWYRGGNGASSATFYSDGSMECSAVNSDDYLCRSGLSFNSDKYYTELDHMYADFKVSLSGQNNIGYSFIGIYGWSEDPMIEYYIVDTWASQYKPGGEGWGWTKKGEYTVNGDKYVAWTHTQVDQWALHGKATFEQFYGVRETGRSCGTIDITAHFKEWEKLGMKLGKMYEAKVLGEVGNGSGTASCNFDFPVARVYTGTAPTSSASTNPTSSASTPTSSAAQNQPSVGTLPGTIEFEDYQSTGGADLTKNGTTLGSINPGAWVEFGVDVSYTGTYEVEVLAARKDADGNKSNLTISIDGKDVGSISDILTDDWSDFKPFTGTTTNIDAGKHTLRVTFDYGWLDVDNIKFTAKDVNMSSKYEPPTSSASAPTSSGSVAPASNGSTTPANNGTNPSNNGAGNEAPEAIGNIHMSLSTMDMQVFDVQGRNLGRVRVNAGASLEETLFAKFHKSGIYLVKQGSQLTKVRVIR